MDRPPWNLSRRRHDRLLVRLKVVASKFSQQTVGQEKLVWGGRPAVKSVSTPSKLDAGPSKAVVSGEPLIQSSNTPHVVNVLRNVSPPCIDVRH